MYRLYLRACMQVLLFGAEDNNAKDRNMQVTVAFTHSGKKLIQRINAQMPMGILPSRQQ